MHVDQELPFLFGPALGKHPSQRMTISTGLSEAFIRNLFPHHPPFGLIEGRHGFLASQTMIAAKVLHDLPRILGTHLGAV